MHFWCIFDVDSARNKFLFINKYSLVNNLMQICITIFIYENDHILSIEYPNNIVGFRGDTAKQGDSLYVKIRFGSRGIKKK